MLQHVDMEHLPVGSSWLLLRPLPHLPPLPLELPDPLLPPLGPHVASFTARFYKNSAILAT